VIKPVEKKKAKVVFTIEVKTRFWKQHDKWGKGANLEEEKEVRGVGVERRGLGPMKGGRCRLMTGGISVRGGRKDKGILWEGDKNGDSLRRTGV